jgi:uncharacterized protein
VSNSIQSRLRFNFGFLLEVNYGTSRTMELDYPTIQLEDDVTLTPLTGKFKAIRNSKGIYITGLLQSNIAVECARCLDPVTVPLDIQLDEMYNYPPGTAPPGEYSIGEDGFIDLAPLVRQLSLLAIPMQPICRADCQGLCMECGYNLNEGDCGCPDDEIDPRLTILRELLDSNS